MFEAEKLKLASFVIKVSIHDEEIWVTTHKKGSVFDCSPIPQYLSAWITWNEYCDRKLSSPPD